MDLFCGRFKYGKVKVSPFFESEIFKFPRSTELGLSSIINDLTRTTLAVLLVIVINWSLAAEEIAGPMMFALITDRLSELVSSLGELTVRETGRAKLFLSCTTNPATSVSPIPAKVSKK